MAGRITEETKIQINELYAKIGVKSKVAKILGISASSVSKYIIPNYIPEAERNIEKFEKQPTGISSHILAMSDGRSVAKALIQMSPEEWNELKELQKGIFL